MYIIYSYDHLLTAANNSNLFTQFPKYQIKSKTYPNEKLYKQRAHKFM